MKWKDIREGMFYTNGLYSWREVDRILICEDGIKVEYTKIDRKDLLKCEIKRGLTQVCAFRQFQDWSEYGFSKDTLLHMKFTQGDVNKNELIHKRIYEAINN